MRKSAWVCACVCFLTVDYMLWGNSLLLRPVADLIGFGGDQVDELGAAVHHQLPGVVGHSHVGKRFFNHFVDGRPRDGEVVVVSGRGSHSLPLNSLLISREPIQRARGASLKRRKPNRCREGAGLCFPQCIALMLTGWTTKKKYYQDGKTIRLIAT